MTLIRAIRFVLMNEVGDVSRGVGSGGLDQAGGSSAQTIAAGTVGQAVLGGANAATRQGAGGTAGAGAEAREQLAAASSAEVGTDGGQVAGDAVSEQNTAIEYADFSVPEGISLNPELLHEFKGIALGLGLKQEQAQQLTDLGVKLTNGLLAQQALALETQKIAWKAEVMADAEIGGDKHDAAMAQAARAVTQFVPDELKALFDQTGIGNHPALVKAFVKIGALLKEDGVVTGGVQLAVKKDARAMYPNSPGLR